MKSKISFCDRALFFDLWKRYWPIFLAYLFIWILMLPVSLNSSLRYSWGATPALQAAQHVMNSGVSGGAAMSAIFGIGLAMAAFNYLYSSRSVSMMCALPVRREAVFISVFSAGLLGMFAVNVIVLLLTLIVQISWSAVGLSYLLQWFLMVCLSNLFFFGLATLCASFTGHILVLPVLYAVLNFTAVAVEMMVRTILEFFIFGFGNTHPTMTILSPLVEIMDQTRVLPIFEPDDIKYFNVLGYFYDSWWTLIIYALVGLVFAACAMILIKRRRMESASDVVAVRPLKPVFKYSLSLGCALVIGLLIFMPIGQGMGGISGDMRTMFVLLACMSIGAFIGYFAAEMLMHKTLRVFSGRNWLRFGVTVLFISVVMIGAELDVFGYERNLPDASEVESVFISIAGEHITLREPQNIEAALAIHSDIISNKRIHESRARAQGGHFYNIWFLRISYLLHDDSVHFRTYQIFGDVTDDVRNLNLLLNSPEAMSIRNATRFEVSLDTIADTFIQWFDPALGHHNTISLSAWQAYELYMYGIRPDIESGNLGEVWFHGSDEFLDRLYAARIEISLTSRVGDQFIWDFFRSNISVDAVHTLRWLEENLSLDLYTNRQAQERRAVYHR